MWRLLAGCTLLLWPRVALADDACASAYEGAQRARRDGALKRAMVELATCTRECSAMVRPDCVRWLGEVEAVMPSVLVIAKDTAGLEVDIASLRIDGVETRRYAQAVELDPGAHEIVVESARGEGRRSVLLREGEQRRVVVVELSRPTGQPTGTVTPTSPPQRPARRVSAPVLALGALGVAGLGVFGVVAATGEARYARLETCRPHCAHDDVQALRASYVAGDIGLAVGLVALGAAALVHVFEPRAGTSP